MPFTWQDLRVLFLQILLFRYYYANSPSSEAFIVVHTSVETCPNVQIAKDFCFSAILFPMLYRASSAQYT